MDVFAAPENLLLLLLLPLIGVLLWLTLRLERRDRHALGDEALVRALLRAPASRRRLLRSGMLLTALLLVIVALARPRIGGGDEELRRKGLQIMVVMDGSRSMAVEDVQPNRFEMAKRLVLGLFDQLDGSQFGMVLFGESSYVQFPLTSDLQAARTLVEPLSVEALESPGSDIAGAIDEAIRSFVPGQTSGRVILLLSDGGDPEQDQPPGSSLEAARRAAAAGIQIYTVGVGEPQGGPIPFRSLRGRRDIIRDESGQPVISRLNQDLLGQIASVTGGSYFKASSLDVDRLVEVMERSAPVELTERLVQTRKERFQILLGLAFLLLVGEYLLLGRRGSA